MALSDFFRFSYFKVSLIVDYIIRAWQNIRNPYPGITIPGFCDLCLKNPRCEILKMPQKNRRNFQFWRFYFIFFLFEPILGWKSPSLIGAESRAEIAVFSHSWLSPTNIKLSPKNLKLKILESNTPKASFTYFILFHFFRQFRNAFFSSVLKS